MLHASYWNNVLSHSSVLTLHSKENYRQLQFPSNSCVRLNINYTSRAQHLIFLFLLPLAISRTVTSNSLLFKSVSVNRENLNFGSPGRQTKNYLKLFPDLLWGEQSFAYKSSLFHCPVPTLNHWSAFVCQLHRYNYNPLDPLQRMMDDTVRFFLSQGKPLDLLVELLEINFVFERFIIPTVDGGCRWGMLRCDFSTFKF